MQGRKSDGGPGVRVGQQMVHENTPQEVMPEWGFCLADADWK